MSERKPLKTFKTGLSTGVQIAAWENQKGVSFTISKRYKDKDSGEWIEAKSFYPSDLAALAHLAPAAIEFADLMWEQEKQNSAGLAPKETAKSFDVDDVPF